MTLYKVINRHYGGTVFIGTYDECQDLLYSPDGSEYYLEMHFED